MTPLTVDPAREQRRFDVSSRDRRVDDPDRRTAGQHDRDRILYSSAFRRLSGITQVASPTELFPVHNRLIHSLKVAQVGRSLAQRLLDQPRFSDSIRQIGGLDPDVVEAAALAHDLGHPPFGHVAEDALDQMLIDGGSADGLPDGYNGNAQSFRIVTTLAVRYAAARDSEIAGLNLSRATLNAILKYPWLRETDGHRARKWGAYASEADDFAWARAGACPVLDGKTVEAALMDWADDITYAVHDVEDFFRAGLIPLDRLASDARELDRLLRWAVQSGRVRDEETDDVRRTLLGTFAVEPGVLGPFRGSRADRAALRSLTSKLISRYVNNSVVLISDGDRVRLEIDPELEREVRIFKLLTTSYVIESPSLVTQRFGQRVLIRSLFRTFCDAASIPSDRAIFPDFYQEAIEYAAGEPKTMKRIVADLISSMSEAQAVAIHQRLTGQTVTTSAGTYLQ